MGSSSSKRRRKEEAAAGDMADKGFQHNQIFKIVSLKDKNVIEVVSNAVVVKKWSNSQSQKFKALFVRPGEFRISSLLDASMSLAWDCEPAEPLLIQSAWQDDTYQKWFAEEIFPNSKIYVIKPSADGNVCLRNAGVGKQVSLSKENSSDVNQHWKMEATY